jgi:drug/metabolite transporter (DMT)-like permease
MGRTRATAATVSLVAVTAVWGSTFVVVKHAVERMPVMDFLAWRFAIAALVMAAVRPRAVARLGAPGRRAGVVLGLALGGGYIAQTFGLQHTTSSVSGFITGLFVVFTPLCAALILRSPITGTAWLAVALATGGLALISLHGGSIGSGEAITLLCAVAFALHIIGLGEWSSSFDAAGLAVVQLTTVAVISIVSAAPSSLSPPPDYGVWGVAHRNRRHRFGLPRADVGTSAPRPDTCGGRHDHGAGLCGDLRCGDRRGLT